MIRTFAIPTALFVLSAVAGSDAFGRPDRDPIVTPPLLVDSRGDVMIMAAPNGEDLIIALDDSQIEPADGVTDRVFLLQRNTAVAPSLADPRLLDDAILQYDDRRVQVVHPDFTASFSVDDPSGTAERYETSRPRVLGELQVTVRGYGLQRSSGRREMSPAALAEGATQGFGCGAASSLLPGYVSQDCASGGPGATQCGLQVGGGCSVTCGAGYYACCNLLGGCKCRVEPA